MQKLKGLEFRALCTHQLQNKFKIKHKTKYTNEN